MKLQVAYKIGELEKLTGLSRYRLLEILQAAGVQTDRLPKQRLVFLSDLRDSCPALWESILARRAAETGEGSAPSKARRIVKNLRKADAE